MLYPGGVSQQIQRYYTLPQGQQKKRYECKIFIAVVKGRLFLYFYISQHRKMVAKFFIYPCKLGNGKGFICKNIINP